MADLIEYEKDCIFINETLGYQDFAYFILDLYPDFLKNYHEILKDIFIIDVYALFSADDDTLTHPDTYLKDIEALGIDIRGVKYDRENEYVLFKAEDWYLVGLCNLHQKYIEGITPAIEILNTDKMIEELDEKLSNYLNGKKENS
jgi:hypothetical protein